VSEVLVLLRAPGFRERSEWYDVRKDLDWDCLAWVLSHAALPQICEITDAGKESRC
jgi:hypothetical protein